MTIDYTTVIGKIRLLINDLDETAFEFTDVQLQAFYDMASESLIQAAILALRTLVAKYNAEAGTEYRIDTVEYRESKSKATNCLSLLKNLEESVANGTNPLGVGIPKTYGIYTTDKEENINRIANGELVAPRTSEEEYTTLRIKQQDGPYYK